MCVCVCMHVCVQRVIVKSGELAYVSFSDLTFPNQEKKADTGNPKGSVPCLKAKWPQKPQIFSRGLFLIENPES